MTENQSSIPPLPFGMRMLKATLQVIATLLGVLTMVLFGVTLYRIFENPLFIDQYRTIVVVSFALGAIVLLIVIGCVWVVELINQHYGIKVIDDTIDRPDVP